MTKPKQSVRPIRLDQLIGHQHNRDLSGDTDLQALADSIREHGLLQPLVVTEHPIEYDLWLILAGHRRVAAARLAGLPMVPCVIRHNLDPDEQLVVMLVENCQRREMTPIDRAEAYGVLRKRGLTMTEIARRTGIVVSAVSHALSLLDLDTESRERIRRGELTARAAKEIVVETRQASRQARGGQAMGRPAASEPAHFTGKHPLAAAVKASCTHHRRPRVGGAGCGQCWEAAIRTDALSELGAA